MVVFYWTTISVFIVLTVLMLGWGKPASDDRILDILGVIISNQDHLNADVAALVAATASISAELAALKAQPAAEQLDFSGLDNVVASLQGLVPAPADAPVEPAPEG